MQTIGGYLNKVSLEQFVDLITVSNALHFYYHKRQFETSSFGGDFFSFNCMPCSFVLKERSCGKKFTNLTELKENIKQEFTAMTYSTGETKFADSLVVDHIEKYVTSTPEYLIELPNGQVCVASKEDFNVVIVGNEVALQYYLKDDTIDCCNLLLP
jgi:hypothetical protein